MCACSECLNDVARSAAIHAQHDSLLFVHEEERSRFQNYFYRTSRVNFASTDADVSSTSYTILFSNMIQKE